MPGFFNEFAYRQHGDQSWINHRHVNGENYEILLVLSGGGNALIYNETWPLKVGTLMLIDSTYPHCINPQRADEYVRNKIILSRSCLRNACGLAGALALLDELTGESGGRCAYLDASSLETVDRLFLDIREADQENTPAKGLVCVSAVLRILAELHRALEENADSPAEIRDTDARIGEVMQYLCKNLTEPLTIERIAEEMHFSKFYMCRIFRRETGMTIMRYLYAQRVSLALRLLSSTSLSVGEIAQRCGFAGSSHMCVKFREYTGVSPRKYRDSGMRAEK